MSNAPFVAMRRRRMTRTGLALLTAVLGTMLAGATAVPPSTSGAGAPRFRALVFSKVTNYYHESIPAGIEAIRTLGASHGFEVVVSDESALFTDDTLATFQVVVFNNTNSTPEKGALLTPQQRAAFQRYIRNGGGFAGIHSASGTERDWDWYGRLVGAFFRSHPKVQELTIRVEDRTHPSTRGLPASWRRTEEPYDFLSTPRDRVHVLASFDTSTYEGHVMGPDHPIAWCHVFEGGRSWYTGLGHSSSAFTDEPLFLAHLRGGIEWAAGAAEGRCGP